MPSKFERLIEAIKEGVKAHDTTKKEQIKECKTALLEVKYQEDKICAKITEELKGYVEPRYIRSVLEEQYKAKSKVRSIIGVTNKGETVTSSSGTTDSRIPNRTYTAVAKAAREVERNIEQHHSDSSEELDSVKLALKEAQETLREQGQLVHKLKTEREEHTTVALNSDKFAEVMGFMKQKAVRILLDFDENMVVKGVRANL